jgi:anti-repressor protein
MKGMNELIKIIENNGNQVVSARDLHLKLGVGRDFSTWIKDRIEKYGFVEGRDYQKSQSPNVGTGDFGHTGGSPTVSYLFTISAAKELAIVENNENGRQVRQYLIKVEEAWNSPQMIMARALQVSQKQLESYRQEIEVLKPKAETLDKITATESDVSIRELAAILAVAHLGQNNLFKKLQQDGYIDGFKRPYRQYIEEGLMYEKEYYVPQLDATKQQLRITQKGVAYFARKYNKVAV